MSRIEDAFLRRFSGAKIVIGSLVLGLIGIMPLSLYIRFGPKDGNPIGLGLLAVVTMPLAAVGMAVGLIKMLVELLQRDRS